MSLAPQHVETLEKAGGFILEQLVAAQAITAGQQSQILAQQRQIEQDTGEKPFVGQLLEQNGIDTSAIKQPLLDLQASSRILLHAHGENATAQRCEGASGTINLQNGVPDNQWTLADMTSGDLAKGQTALLQTRLLQTKVLVTASNMLEAHGRNVPEPMLNALQTLQDAGHEGLAAATQALRQAGKSPDSVEEALNALPNMHSVVNQEVIHAGMKNAITELGEAGLLTPDQEKTLQDQEQQRNTGIGELQLQKARRQARNEMAAQKPQSEGVPPPGPRSQAILDRRSHKPEGPVPGF